MKIQAQLYITLLGVLIDEHKYVHLSEGRSLTLVYSHVSHWFYKMRVHKVTS